MRPRQLGSEPASTPAEPGSGRGDRRRARTLARHDARTGLALISPTLVVVLAVVVVPMAWTFVMAFQRLRLLNLRRSSVFGDYTLANLRLVLTSKDTWDSLLTTLTFTVGATSLSILLGLVAALAVRCPFRGRAVVRAAMLLPYITPVVAATYVWRTLLHPQFGVVNDWGTRFLGWDQEVAFLSQPRGEISLLGLDIALPTALLTVIAFEAWRQFPFAFLFLLARLQAVPGEIEDAGRMDGATPLQSFRHILLPQLMPTIAVLAVLRLIWSLNEFDDIYLLTGGGADTEVVSVKVYHLLATQHNVGAAAAQALVLAAMLLVLVWPWLRILKRRGERQ
jgi:multiple sugar transport system permease protein